MKVLYGVQATGNGHISRSKTIIPHLKKIAEVDILVSGHSSDVDLGYPVKYKCSGIGYSFGRNGGIDYLDTVLNLHPASFLKDVQRIPVHSYDLVISDFEPVTAWACWFADKECIGLSHQASFLSQKTPRPAVRNITGEFIFRNYAPVTRPIGFHFNAYDSFIYTPVIRKEIRNVKPKNGAHLTVYLPAYGFNVLLKVFSELNREVHIFSKVSSRVQRLGNVTFFPVSRNTYIDSLVNCEALICGAGFEAPSEALYLGKKLLCIPMKDQYEQKCNAEALRRMGVKTCDQIDEHFSPAIQDLLDSNPGERLFFPDVVPLVTENIFNLVG